MFVYWEESGINNKKKNVMCVCKLIVGYYVKEIEVGFLKSYLKIE